MFATESVKMNFDAHTTAVSRQTLWRCRKSESITTFLLSQCHVFPFNVLITLQATAAGTMQSHPWVHSPGNQELTQGQTFCACFSGSLLSAARPSGTSSLISVPLSSDAAQKGDTGCLSVLRQSYKRNGSLRVMADSSEPGLYFKKLPALQCFDSRRSKGLGSGAK